jgi:isoleucyl-tRNA synthetase
VSDRIQLTLDGDPELLDAARAHQEYIAGEVLALEVSYAALEGVAPVIVDGLQLRYVIAQAARRGSAEP